MSPRPEPSQVGRQVRHSFLTDDSRLRRPQTEPLGAFDVEQWISYGNEEATPCSRCSLALARLRSPLPLHSVSLAPRRTPRSLVATIRLLQSRTKPAKILFTQLGSILRANRRAAPLAGRQLGALHFQRANRSPLVLTLVLTYFLRVLDALRLGQLQNALVVPGNRAITFARSFL